MENKLPEGWEWKKLGDVSDTIMGQSPAGETYNEHGEGMPFLQGKAEFTDSCPKHVKYTTSPSKIAPEGSILISVRAPVGDVNIANLNYCIGRGLASISLKNGDNKFLFYLLRYLKPEIESKGTGSTFKAISKSILYDLIIPLPPLETQQKIVSILEKAEETKKLRAQADKLTQKLLQSVFLEMFGDPVENPKNWDVEKVQDVISSIEAGWSANGEQRPREENEYAVLKVSAVTQGIFLPEECKVINKDIEFKKVVTPEKGDVLFSRANTLELVGASCLIRENHPYLLLPDKLWKIMVNEEKICPEYFKFVLSSTAIRSEISKRSTGTSGSMYNISMNKLKLIEITVPPIEIQKKFSIIVETIEKTKDFEKQSSLEINTLFDALMQKAFTGELLA